MKHVQSFLTANTYVKTAIVLLSFFTASLLLAVATVAVVLKCMAE